MMTVFAPHKPKADHLALVTRRMRKLGPPSIRVVDAGDCYYALEGSHRLAAAHALGLTPTLEVMAEDDDMGADYGIDPADLANADVGWDGKGPVTAGMVLGYLSRSSAVPYRFEQE